MRAFSAQARAEVWMTLRNGESLLLAIGIPVLLLVFFSTVDVLPTPTGTDRPVNFLAPGIIALAVMSTGLVNLAIATGFQRGYGVLKRLGTTPLSRSGLLGAKIVAVLAVELVQVAVLVPVAAALGWSPSGAVGAALAAVLLGTIAFCGLGLLMAGALKPELTLALANGLYLVMLLLGGMVVPLASLPAPLRAAARALPAAALSDALRASVGEGATVPGRAWLVLAAWAAAAPVAAARSFRWE
ncbi:MAG: Efflux ABC transporter, permease protein [uncultured Acidimicrobiales bacterium]|uniref:Transport permease protein n=1 Tax=uncultured Acidimicrobiales bacterium TaxID=310071 RepID=A0A6J4HKU7_9ACTN|nr:MAG: Efflux ABC transporter, permease protein [uncultured Acidimicrobiales bacterium]